MDCQLHLRVDGKRSDGELLLVAQDRGHGHRTYRTRDEARADVFDYIQRFYNLTRKALDDRLPEPYGVREAGWISCECNPNPGADQPPAAIQRT